MDREGEKSLVAFIQVTCLCAVAFIIFVVGYIAGQIDGKHIERTAAVRNNVGEWIPTVNGDTTFKWKHLKVEDYLKACDPPGFHNPATAEDYEHMHDYLQPKEKPVNGK